MVQKYHTKCDIGIIICSVPHPVFYYDKMITAHILANTPSTIKRLKNREWKRKWNEKNAEHVREYSRKWHEKNAEHVREYKIKKRYGITGEDYDEIYNKQKGMCMICESKHDRLHCDHNHITGKIRGLLCHSCNVGLGLFRDDMTLLYKAIQYIKIDYNNS